MGLFLNGFHTIGKFFSVITGTVINSITEAGQPTLFLTGGGADLLAAYTSLPKIEVVAGLVLDGLAIACPYSPEGFDPANG